MFKIRQLTHVLHAGKALWGLQAFTYMVGQKPGIKAPAMMVDRVTNIDHRILIHPGGTHAAKSTFIDQRHAHEGDRRCNRWMTTITPLAITRNAQRM